MKRTVMLRFHVEAVLRADIFNGCVELQMHCRRHCRFFFLFFAFLLFIVEQAAPLPLDKVYRDELRRAFVDFPTAKSTFSNTS